MGKSNLNFRENLIFYLKIVHFGFKNLIFVHEILHLGKNHLNFVFFKT